MFTAAGFAGAKRYTWFVSQDRHQWANRDEQSCRLHHLHARSELSCVIQRSAALLFTLLSSLEPMAFVGFGSCLSACIFCVSCQLVES